jgi:hypothetical protein
MTGTDPMTQGLIAGELSEIAKKLLGDIDTKRRVNIVYLEAEYVYQITERLEYFSKKLKGEL